MDGKSGLGLGELLFDLEPEPAGPYEPVLGALAGESIGARDPSNLELIARALPHVAAMPLRSVGFVTGMAGRAVAAARVGKAPGLPALNGPATSLNGAVGKRRHLVMASIGLADTKRLSKHFDVKVNDIVMAVVAGATRRYLQRHDELPEGAMAAMMNFSTRRPGQTKHNAVTTSRVELPTHLDDPVERLQAVYRATSHAKEAVAAMSAKDIQSVGGIAPPVVLNLASRLLVSNTLIDRYPRFAAVIVSNMPGPPVPLYVAGAEVKAIYTTSIIMGNVPTNMTCVSYVDRIDFGITIDPDLVRSSDELTDDLPFALQELLDAAGLGPAEPVEDLFAGAAPEG